MSRITSSNDWTSEAFWWTCSGSKLVCFRGLVQVLRPCSAGRYVAVSHPWWWAMISDLHTRAVLLIEFCQVNKSQCLPVHHMLGSRPFPPKRFLAMSHSTWLIVLFSGAILALKARNSSGDIHPVPCNVVNAAVRHEYTWPNLVCCKLCRITNEAAVAFTSC